MVADESAKEVTEFQFCWIITRTHGLAKSDRETSTGFWFPANLFLLPAGFAEAVRSVVQVHAVDGKVVGDAEFFQKLETDIKEP